MGSRKSETFFALIILQLSIFSGINVASATSDEQDIEILIENFNAQDVNVKADSVKALVEAGKPAVEPLIQACSWAAESRKKCKK